MLDKDFNLEFLWFFQETQLQHEVTMKNALLEKFLKDQEFDEDYQLTNRSDEESRRYIVFRIVSQEHCLLVWRIEIVENRAM